MKLVERHIIKKSDNRWKSLDDICFLSKNLYNSALYFIRKHKEETGKFISKTLDPEILKQYLIDIREQYPNLFTYGTFIVGLPKDTIEKQREVCDWLNQSKPFDMWFWFPLSIKGNTDSGEVLSPIEQDYIKYGYENRSDQSDLVLPGRGLRDQNVKIVSWKNDSMDLSTATNLCNELNDISAMNIKCNPWIIFDMSVVYQSIKWWHKFCVGQSISNPFNEVRTKTNEFVYQYKQKKLKYFAKT
jgi:hypothetical protein